MREGSLKIDHTNQLWKLIEHWLTFIPHNCLKSHKPNYWTTMFFKYINNIKLTVGKERPTLAYVFVMIRGNKLLGVPKRNCTQINKNYIFYIPENYSHPAQNDATESVSLSGIPIAWAEIENILRFLTVLRHAEAILHKMEQQRAPRIGAVVLQFIRI